MQTTNIQNPSLLSSLSTAVQTLVATPAPASGLIVSALTFCNKSSANVTVTCSIYNGTTDFYLAYNAPVAIGDTLVLGGDVLKVMLTNGFSIRGYASAINSVDFTASSVLFT
jgi:hypothetical protein